ncbi:MAG: HEAT repeat domain-containing protein [Myxococcota bacterium]
MSESTVYMLVYGLAVAPLGMGMLSLQLRRVAAAWPLRRTQVALRAFCEDRGWSEPDEDPTGSRACGILDGRNVKLEVGRDPSADDGSTQVRSVWIRIRFARGEDAWPRTTLLVELHRRAVLKGEARSAQAVLGSELGRFALAEDLFEVTATEVRFDRFTNQCDHEDIAMLLSRVGHTWRALSSQAPNAVLRQQVLQGPNPSIRVAALCSLVSDPHTGDHAPLLRRALADPSAEVRLEAALRIGDEGNEVLSRLLNSDHHVDLRIRAFVALTQRQPALVVESLDELTRDRSDRLTDAVVRWAADNGHMDLLKRVLADENAPTGARIQAISALEHPSNEPLFYPCLEPSVAPGLVIAAADALGRIGSGPAKAKLGGLLVRGAHHRSVCLAARAALELIQARTTADSGRLSLVDPNDPEGALSLTPDCGNVGARRSGASSSDPLHPRPRFAEPPEPPGSSGPPSGAAVVTSFQGAG